MRHAYLIIAHDDFYLLKRLVQVIDNPSADIYIHLDASKKYRDAQQLYHFVRYSRLYLFSKLNIKWGGIAKFNVSCC